VRTRQQVPSSTYYPSIREIVAGNPDLSIYYEALLKTDVYRNSNAANGNTNNNNNNNNQLFRSSNNSTSGIADPTSLDPHADLEAYPGSLVGDPDLELDLNPDPNLGPDPESDPPGTGGARRLTNHDGTPDAPDAIPTSTNTASPDNSGPLPKQNLLLYPSMLVMLCGS
jgi:hypothetical protein